VFDDLYRDLARVLSPASIMKTHLVARAALDRAVRWRWIAHNPALAAEPPTVHRPTIRPPPCQGVGRISQLMRTDAAAL
jgi:integrase